MPRSALLLLIATVSWAAQPTLTTMSDFAPATEDTPFVFTYDDLVGHGNESANTTRFKITGLVEGSIASRAHGSSGAWVAVSSLPFFFDGTVDVQWTPAADTNGLRGSILVRANDGLDDLAADNSSVDVPVSVNLSAVIDTPRVSPGENKRTLGGPRLVAATEDTWNQFTFANLVTLTGAHDVDGDAINGFVIDAILDGTVASTSGGTPLVAGDVITSAQSLWWRPSPDTFTKQGATAATDEAPLAFVSIKARKTSGTDYLSAAVTVASTIDGTADAFDTTSTSFPIIEIDRGGFVQMDSQGWLSRIVGFDNVDRNAQFCLTLFGTHAVDFIITSYDQTGAIVDSKIGLPPIHSPYLLIEDGWSLRLQTPNDLKPGTYTIGTIEASRDAPGPGQQLSTDVALVVKIRSNRGGKTESTSSSSGGVLGCGAGTATGILLGCTFLLLPLRRRRP